MTDKEKLVTRTTLRRAISTGVAAGVAVGLLVGPASPSNATGSDAPECTVDSADLRWGVKERFRNYISGSIANGEWTTENGVTYETPAFQWANGAGKVNADLTAGQIDFTGDVHFTGHGGLMQLDLQDPSIVFTGPQSAQLVLTMGSRDTEEGEVTPEPVVAALIDTAGADLGDGSRYAIEQAPVRLTAEGAAHFNGEYGDYVAGEDMDAVALTMSVSGCTLGADTGVAAPAPSEDSGAVGQPLAPATEAPRVPWVPIAIGGAALVVIGVTAGMLIAGRKRRPEDGAPASDESAVEDEGQAGDPASPGNSL